MHDLNFEIFFWTHDRTLILNVIDLKRWLTAAWSGLQQHVIDEAIDQLRGQLHTCVRADGWHFNALNCRFRITVNVACPMWLFGPLLQRFHVWHCMECYTNRWSNIKSDVVGCQYMFCCKFPRVCCCQKLAKSDNVWMSYHKHKRVTFILRHSVYSFSCTPQIGLEWGQFFSLAPLANLSCASRFVGHPCSYCLFFTDIKR